MWTGKHSNKTKRSCQSSSGYTLSEPCTTQEFPGHVPCKGHTQQSPMGFPTGPPTELLSLARKRVSHPGGGALQGRGQRSDYHDNSLEGLRWRWTAPATVGPPRRTWFQSLSTQLRSLLAPEGGAGGAKKREEKEFLFQSFQS